MITSPLRQDNKPTCAFYYGKTGRLYLHDFATEEHLDCIEIVKRKFNLNYPAALKKIITERYDFSYSEPMKKGSSEFSYTVGSTSQYEYFHQFGIANKTLTSYRVIPVKTVLQEEKVIAKSTKTNPLFAYSYPSGRVKIYRPLARDSMKKWSGNSTSEDIGGLDQLSWTGQILFITSSLKDVMVLRELGYNAIAFNGEGFGVGKGKSYEIVRDTISRLSRRFTHIIFYMNNDSPGIDFNKRLSQTHRRPFIHNPVGKPKDISDVVRKYSSHVAKRMIKRLLSKQFNLNSPQYDFLSSASAHQHRL